ncbi:polyamine ABC transporter ATP-binding protein [Nitrospirillum amazonense]|uniref:Spermidine/putrescine import ATP-binding protein PotA n=2 Tax=Nitrospirillum TaxID=1543705 RepID=A0A248JUL3_9PROT|nr:polyamine ABC transporter ATP-binding protein [Nitrospirillum amazonense]ASG21914.1 polyamine ABC transporter ATP-binding protein [Nitrospirillum amazonense CBAmc]MEC4591396.1 polyamine ABC transporter ATP-binding protein [Nitrospirillum amazonense]TWB28943.1 putrescine transport system ATP-binding protein [Nitrospirillum amazonense]TWB37771.1 putrescine transport system ATP-binding protein [Nitrospirillum amazonense]TWB63274.1 putrescine transport system ATP-binding protein [Nitrospirillum
MSDAPDPRPRPAATGPIGKSPAAKSPAVKFEPWHDPAAKPYIRIEKVTKRFGDFTAVDNVSLSIYRGEFFSLLGGSGSGKTTLLRMLAGFEQPTEGRIFIDGVDMAGIPPYDRPVNMMFQSYALFPHMTVENNVAFGLRQDGVPKDEIRTRVAEMLELVKLTPFAKRKPHQLSGGQRQRVALARSLVKKPKLLLLDEPLGALDKRLREQTQFELVNIQEKLGVTFVVVTHDQEEAMTMSTRIAVMDHGAIAQVGTPTEIYEYPNSRFTAEFIGSVNMFEGNIVESEPDHSLIRSAEAGCDLYVTHTAHLAAGSHCWVAIRPEKVSITKEKPAEADGGRNVTRGVVREIAYLGDISIYQIDLASGKRVRATAPNVTRRTELPITWDDEVWLSWRPFAGVVLTD